MDRTVADGLRPLHAVIVANKISAVARVLPMTRPWLTTAARRRVATSKRLAFLRSPVYRRRPVDGDRFTGRNVRNAPPTFQQALATRNGLALTRPSFICFRSAQKSRIGGAA